MARNARPWYRKSRSMWYASVGGRQTPLGVGDPSAEAAAWAAFQQLVSAVRGDPAPAMPARFLTTQSLCEAFLTDRVRHVRADTVRGYRAMLDRFLARYGTVRPGGVGAAEVEADAAARGWSDTTVHNYLSTVEQVLKWGGYPVKFRKPPKASAGADSVIPAEAFEKILCVAVGDWRAVIRFLWLTGCRPQEAATLTAESVDWSAGVAKIRHHKLTHRGKVRTVYLSPDALELLKLQRVKHPDGFLFRGKGGRPFSRQAFVMKFQRLSGRIGRRVTAYGLRHSFATRALENGIPEAQVAELLGHTGTAMLFKHYAHLCTNARLLRERAAQVSAPRAG